MSDLYDLYLSDCAVIEKRIAEKRVLLDALKRGALKAE